MQTKFWKLYTPTTLPPEISCISPPTYYTSTRFGIPFGPFFNLANKNRNISSAGKLISYSENRKTMDEDKLDVDQIIQREIKSRIIPSPVSPEFVQTNVTVSSQPVEVSLLTNFSQMSIPIQPRKNLSTNSSTNSFDSNSLRSNVSEFKVFQQLLNIRQLQMADQQRLILKITRQVVL